jgi:hypothetical protein
VISYARLQRIQVNTTYGFGAGGARQNGAMIGLKFWHRGALPFVLAGYRKSPSVRTPSDCEEINMTVRQDSAILLQVRVNGDAGGKTGNQRAVQVLGGKQSSGAETQPP